MNRTPDATVPEAACPTCGHIADAAYCPEKLGARPRAGDLTICIHCAGLSEFTFDLSRREIPKTAIEKMPAEQQTQIYNAMIAVRAVNAKAKKA